MHALVGYCDRWSVKPGQRITFMVSSAGDAPYELAFVRHLCADPNPQGPGYREVPMPTALDGTRPGQAQAARLGSCATAAGVTAAGAVTLRATVWPTLPDAGPQGVVSLVAAQGTLVLGVDGGAFAALTQADGSSVRVSVAHPMLRRRWYDVEATLADGSLTVVQRPHAPLGRTVDGGTATAAAAPFPGGRCDVLLAALPGPSGFLNGKLERPVVQAGGTVAASWDFAQGIGTAHVPDTGPAAAHATLHNLPTRAMTGSNWTGEVHDWKQAPDQYAAVHFHDDDQGDLGWAPSVTLDVPPDWPSGFYAARLSRDGKALDYVPFFVRPAQPSAALALLVPTFTYQVYGCYLRPGRGAEIRERVTAWGALTETPDMNPEFGLSTYNYHRDGSGVAITTMLRPMLDTRPRQMSLMDPVPGGSGTGRICADSYIVDWLDRLGVPVDIVTDHDLHAEGVDALAPYTCVIAAQHPEYHSMRMMTALEQYLGGGGRLMYLGGNGFYWRAEPSEDAPHALEVRRAESGIRVWATEAGESYHAFGGGYGGLWRRIGKPGQRLVGSSFSVQGRHLGFPYRFTEGIDDPRATFMRDGLQPVAGAAFGDSGFMGGGAAGFELDSVDAHFGTPPHTLIVAKGVVIHPDYCWVNEDMLTIRHPRKQEDWSCADMLFFETPAGGAVFSVGSMTYVGSLPPEGYGNTLATLTTNVLRRFLDRTPFA